MKKVLAILVVLVMVLGLTSVAFAEEVTKENIKLGFVHISDPSDMGYTYNHDVGTKVMMEAVGLREDQVINKYNVSENPGECGAAINELIDAGCNMIFGTSFGFGDAMLPAAQEHPEIEFCHATGYYAAMYNLPNYHNYFASIYEARYLAGIAAGLKTQTNKLGYVAAFPFAEVISGYTSFYLGAKSVNPDVEMFVMYTNSWNDPTVEAQVAKALIDMGADVISQHSDSTAPATTAETNGVFQVGYNADMIPAAPNASLVSARVDWSKYLIFAVESYLAGEPIPTDWSQGYAEGAVYLSPLNEIIIADGTAEAIKAAEQALLSGELKVFAGPLTDAAGNVVVKEGEYFHEQETESAPSWSFILQGITVIEG
ncbi:MAG: BMP family ABC transporter substrate-binding protein [Firmicutes bacterium]|nr:BMP family ABC transporter substrate-binding protein [Bacillota bacterium]